ncbi:MAG: 2-hydroxychromene-2-carboxylate isomerase [Bradymonadia bacterium]
MTAKVIDFYYDIVCPYAYLASTQLDAFAERNNVTFRWKPVLLGGIFRSIGGKQVPMSSMSAPRARLNMLDMHRWADLWGVPLTMPTAHPRRSVESMRWLTALEGAARIQISRRLFEAYWVDGLDVSNVDVLQEIAVEAGVSSEDMTSADAREGLFQTTAEAVEAGAFGVPAFVYNDELFWGQDRLPILEQALGVAPQVSEATETGAPMRLRFFHDFSSPFSYLAATQIEDVAARHGLEVDWCPILLGALFREIGTPDVPLFEMNEAKRRYMGKDLTDWSQRWRVPFRFPDRFPIRSVRPLRAALVEPALTLPLYRAAWVKGEPIEDESVLASIIEQAGFESARILARTNDPDIKMRLRENTDAARAAGVCGVPSFEVTNTKDHSKLLFWGQDRLNMVEAALRGWRPECG